jgi:hypothetical protein
VRLSSAATSFLHRPPPLRLCFSSAPTRSLELTLISTRAHFFLIASRPALLLAADGRRTFLICTPTMAFSRLVDENTQTQPDAALAVDTPIRDNGQFGWTAPLGQPASQPASPQASRPPDRTASGVKFKPIVTAGLLVDAKPARRLLVSLGRAMKAAEAAEDEARNQVDHRRARRPATSEPFVVNARTLRPAPNDKIGRRSPTRPTNNTHQGRHQSPVVSLLIEERAAGPSQSERARIARLFNRNSVPIPLRQAANATREHPTKNKAN